MRWNHQIRLRLRSLFRRDRVERDIDEELRYHLDRQIDEFVAAGMTPDDARYAALRSMGGLDQRKEQCRDALGVRMIDELQQDVRYALRQFAGQPGFTAVAVLSLALAIGGNSLIYGILDGVVFHPFPYPDPDRLVSVGVAFPKLSADTTYVETLSPAEYQDIRTSASFSHTAAFDLGNRNISGGDVPERVFTALLLDDLFPVMGMAPVLGRGFTREELEPNGPPVVIISHRLWQTRFAGDNAVLERAIRIGGRSASIVGVMPPGLRVLGTDMWMPWGGDPASVPRSSRQFTILARLSPNGSIERANAELATIAAQVDRAERPRFAEYENWQLKATPWAAALFQDVRPAAFLILASVGLVLLIACANLINLFLARATTRRRELAVRLALGAGRQRVARQLLTESLLLALTGAVGGLAIAYVGMQGANMFIPPQGQQFDLKATFNVRVLWWSLGLALVSGLAVGVLPAIRAMRTSPQAALRSDTRTGADRGGRRVRQGLVVAEIALSVLLLLGAGLLARSFLNLQLVDPGFASREVLTMRLTLSQDIYPGETVNAFFDRLTDRLTAIPGVESVSVASQIPPVASFATQFRIERGQAEGTTTLPSAVFIFASPTHFQTLRVPVVGGRGIAAGDRLNAPRVAVINRTMASRFFPGVDPIGQRLSIGGPQAPLAWATIVGIVADIRSGGLARPVRPEIYLPVHQQAAWNQFYLLLRAERAAESLLPAVRQAVVSLDPDQPIYAVQTLQDAMKESVFQQRVSAVLIGIFASIALVLAAIGIYGVMAYTVSARTREMGVRLALGAQRRDLIWLVLRQVLAIAATGLALGLGGLAVGGLGVRSLLVGVTAADPLTLAGVTATLGAVAIAAGWLPAWRASRVDPIQALRCD